MFYSRQKNSNIRLLLITQQTYGNLKIAAPLMSSILATVGLTQQERFSAISLQIFRHQVFHLWHPKTMIGLPKVFTENSDSMTLLKLDGFKCTVSRGMDRIHFLSKLMPREKLPYPFPLAWLRRDGGIHRPIHAVW